MDIFPQGYALCALDYEFHILDNAFLGHRPGIKTINDIEKRNPFQVTTRKFIANVLLPELEILYGKRKDCYVVKV